MGMTEGAGIENRKIENRKGIQLREDEEEAARSKGREGAHELRESTRIKASLEH